MSAQIVQYLQLLVKQHASDLHMAAQSAPMLRVNGELVRVDVPVLRATDIEKLVTEILTPEQKKELVTNKQVDFALKATGLGVFRLNVFFQRHGLGLVARALAETPPSLEDLSLPNICKVACNFPNGLVLVTGPTGSGKSTTLAAMINHINTNSRGHILTLEDPVEYHHDSKRCMVNQRQFGTHFTSFASALKSSLREDPDVILVGEMRDPETMALAITAAETGHLVFATLHTNSASKTIDRILDSFPSDQQPQIRSMLSESLRCVISQKLVPSADRRGRIAFFDVLVNNSAVANLIREGKTYQVSSIMQTSRKEGMQILDQSLNDAVKQGLVSGADAWEHANDKSVFQNFAPRDMQNLGIASPGKTMAGVTQITRKSGAAVPTLPPSGKKVG